MTFIAAVIAKKGVAIVADSLATTIERVVNYDHFMNYLKQKQESEKGGEVRIDRDEIVQLFEKKPSHTNDYAEKLFQFDQFTAITLAGASRLGGNLIESYIREQVAINAEDKYYQSKSIETRVSEFCSFINEKAIESVRANINVSRSKLLFIHYEPATETTSIFRITVGRILKDNSRGKNWDYVIGEKVTDKSVVLEGYSRISRGILEGEKILLTRLVPVVMEAILEDLDISLSSLPADYKEELSLKLSSNLKRDDEINLRLLDLSLQQAVDLAHLFMKIEVGFQKYTQNIPSVGGIIRLAVIDKQGFRFIAGHNIIKPY